MSIETRIATLEKQTGGKEQFEICIRYNGDKTEPTTDMYDVLKRMECPKHGKAMGIVVQCRECTYTLGFGWKDGT